MVNIIDLLKELCRKIKKINDEKFDVASLQNICDGRSLPFEDDISLAGSAVLVGNMVRIYFSSLEALGIGAGNITNEVIGTVTFYADNFISTLYGGRINSGAGGGIASFYINHIGKIDANTVFDLNISATHQEIAGTKGYFAVPVILDTTAF